MFFFLFFHSNSKLLAFSFERVLMLLVTPELFSALTCPHDFADWKWAESLMKCYGQQQQVVNNLFIITVTLAIFALIRQRLSQI